MLSSYTNKSIKFIVEMPGSGTKCQIINAPARERPRGEKKVFLAGTTSPTDDGDWHWDSTWREDISFTPYREQVEWELDMQESADIVVVYFHPATKAPISLLELGLCARTGKAIVVCPEGFWKRGNVQIVYDDLFADDFEPVNESVPEPEAAAYSTPTLAADAQPPVIAPLPEPSSQPSPVPDAPRTLAHSRHAKPAHQQRPRKHSPKKSAPPQNATASANTGDASGTSESSSTPAPGPTPPTTSARPGSNTALADRLASGANPRTKLSDSELAEKMERMRILSAEKARKFEQAERDSRSHAIAYEKGMEEARRRRAEEAERRRRGEEERRQMDQERAANRERKLKAMGAREGGWDEGKTAEEDRDRRGFRGANGGHPRRSQLWERREGRAD
ncbi:hypothetical protein ONZ43_g7512 [Nemania bipapillata]|uniref:Uncharacterized protein n=1 Tax=Nemania bipapillata TaxID=110536 RepID=A0ACC2HR28_9PEZI|nr:hypothetical protein ONZ43_g7512 [Nemania bipapillata]